MLLCLHPLPFAMLPALVGNDEPHYALMAHSLAHDRDLDVADDFRAVAAGSSAAGRRWAGQRILPHVLEVDGRQVFAHPLGLPLLAAPLLALHALITPHGPPDLALGGLTLAVTLAGLLAGATLAARLTREHRDAALLVSALYLGSPLWFYSRTFLTEPYTWSWALLGLWAVTSGRLCLAAVFLALTLAMKETALLLVGPILVGCGVLLGWRKAAVVALGPALFALLFAGKNLVLVGTPLATFQPFRRGDPLQGAIGLLVDPAHGLVWFAPVVVVAAAGWLLRPASAADRWLGVLSLLAFASYIAVSAAWVDWTGGGAYAARLIVPALPCLAIPLARILRAWPSPQVAVALGVLLVAGFVVGWCAALDPLTAAWGVRATDLVASNAGAAVAGVAVGAIVVRVALAPRPSGT